MSRGRPRLLSVREQKFVDNYFIMSPAEAARAAGYSTSGLSQQASLLLSRDCVVKEITKIRNRLATKNISLCERIRDELAAMSFASVTDFYNSDGELDLANADPDKLKAIEEIYFNSDGSPNRIKLCSKVQSLRSLGEHIDVNAFNRSISIDVVHTLNSKSDLQLDDEIKQLTSELNGSTVIDSTCDEIPA